MLTEHELKMYLAEQASDMASGTLAQAVVLKGLALPFAAKLHELFDRAVNTGNLPSWQVRAVLDGVRVLPDTYERHKMLKVAHSGIVSRSALNNLAAKGATILLDDAQSAIPEVADICRMITEVTDRPSAGTIFASAGHSEGFGLHQDAEDVIVIQIKGSKMWQIYEPLEMKASSMLLEKQVGACLFDGELHEGDILLMPKGSPHKTATGNREGSLHLTIGIYPVTLRDLICRLVREDRDLPMLDREVNRLDVVDALKGTFEILDFSPESISTALKTEAGRLIADNDRFELHVSDDASEGGRYRLEVAAGSTLQLLLEAQLGRSNDKDLERIVKVLDAVGKGGYFKYADVRKVAENPVVTEEVLHCLLRMRMVIADI